MLLRTGNAELRRVNSAVNDLIEEIRADLEYRDDDTLPLNSEDLKILLSRITKPLTRVKTEGNYDVLQDSLDLYDSAIKKLEKIIQDRQFSDEKAISESELATFESARDLLKTSRANGKGLIKDICDELGQQYKSGDLEEEFYQYRAENSSEVKTITAQIDVYKQAIKGSDYDIDRNSKQIGQIEEDKKALDQQIALLQGSKIYPSISKEIETFKRSQETKERLGKLDQEISDIEKRVYDTKISAKERTKLLSERAVLVLRREGTLTKAYPQEMKKIQRKQGEDEVDYYSRLEAEFTNICKKQEDALRTKVTAMLDKKIWVPALDNATKKLGAKEQEFRARYFPGKAKDAQLTTEDLSKFINLLENDDKQLQQLIDARITEKKGLEDKKQQLEKSKEDLETEKKNQELELAKLEAEKADKIKEVAENERSRTKDDEEKRIKNLSKFEMWRQRMAFRFKNRDMLFASKAEVEAAMIEKKVAAAKLKVDPNAILTDLENKRKQFRADLQSDTERENTKQALKDTAKKEIFRRWDDER